MGISSISPTDEAANIALSELALDSAIEIEKFQKKLGADFERLRQLGQLLGRYDLSDLALVPVYDRALASTKQGSLNSTEELKNKLHEISMKVDALVSKKDADSEMLKEFCLGLHEVLLNYRVENSRRESINRMVHW